MRLDEAIRDYQEAMNAPPKPQVPKPPIVDPAHVASVVKFNAADREIAVDDAVGYLRHHLPGADEHTLRSALSELRDRDSKFAETLRDRRQKPMAFRATLDRMHTDIEDERRYIATDTHAARASVRGSKSEPDTPAHLTPAELRHVSNMPEAEYKAWIAARNPGLDTRHANVWSGGARETSANPNATMNRGGVRPAGGKPPTPTPIIGRR